MESLTVISAAARRRQSPFPLPPPARLAQMFDNREHTMTKRINPADYLDHPEKAVALLNECGQWRQ